MLPPLRVVTPETLSFEPTISAPGLARDAIQAMEFAEPPANDLSLAVTELVTNSVIHADLPDGARIDVKVYRRTESVRVEVCDPGRAFAIAPREPDDFGGRGLMILDAVAERWGISRNGETCVWFEMPLDDAGNIATA